MVRPNALSWLAAVVSNKALDRSGDLGLKVVLDVSKIIRDIPCVLKIKTACNSSCSDGSCWPYLESRVRALANYSAVAAWYTADEPEGYVSPDLLAEAHRRIRRIDDRPVVSIYSSVMPYHHCGAEHHCANYTPPEWQRYQDSVDIIAFDAYPFGNHIPVPGGNGREAICHTLENSLSGHCSRNLSVVTEAIDGIVSYQPAHGKPLWLIAQAFGNREAFRREPSAQEQRAVTYLALVRKIFTLDL